MVWKLGHHGNLSNICVEFECQFDNMHIFFCLMLVYDDKQEWWTHLWLNEGFASWIEYLCVDHCFPEYDIWTQFVSADYTRALDLDALDSSHPIEVGRSFFIHGRFALEVA